MYEDRFARLLRVPTVSRQEEDAPFPAFRAELEALFPLLFSTAETEDFGGSLLLRWRGKKSGAPLLFMNHHDVVAAEGSWTHPPFAGEVADGKIFGRGALDTKGGLFCMMQAAEELIAEGFVPEEDIYFESACTEETTGNGADRISRALEARGVRFALCLDEGGMIVDDPLGCAPGQYAMVGMGEKGCADLRFVARSQGGHASMPGKNTPLVRLGRFIAAAARQNDALFPAELSETTAEMLRRLSPRMTGILAQICAHPHRNRLLLTRQLPARSPGANAMMRTTLAFTTAGGSPARNVLPEEAFVTGNMRFSHHQGGRASIEAVAALAKRHGVETEILDPGMDSPVSRVDSEGFCRLEAAISAVFPGVVSLPYVCTGASDARYFTRVCDCCLRFLPFPVSDAQLGGIHGADENLDVSALAPAVRFYRLMMGGRA